MFAGQEMTPTVNFFEFGPNEVNSVIISAGLQPFLAVADCQRIG